MKLLHTSLKILFLRATNDYNIQRLLLLESEEQLSVLDARHQDARCQFERMRRTNVLNAAFPIWYNGHIGVINGLHLGRLPTKPVCVFNTICFVL